MSKKVCVFEYSEEEWQKYCQEHKVEWKAFGEKIKKIRIQLRLSKKRLANEAGISIHTLSKLESGCYISRFKLASTSCLNALIKIYQGDHIELITTL